MREHIDAGFGVRADQAHAGPSGGAIGNVAPDRRNRFDAGGEHQELLGRLESRRSGNNGGLAVVQDLAIPHDRKRLALQYLGIEYAPVVSRAHHNFLIG